MKPLRIRSAFGAPATSAAMSQRYLGLVLVSIVRSSRATGAPRDRGGLQFDPRFAQRFTQQPGELGALMDLGRMPGWKPRKLPVRGTPEYASCQAP
jgi:hypothetical protein